MKLSSYLIEITYQSLSTINPVFSKKYDYRTKVQYRTISKKIVVFLVLFFTFMAI